MHTKAKSFFLSHILAPCNFITQFSKFSDIEHDPVYVDLCFWRIWKCRMHYTFITIKIAMENTVFHILV